MSTGLQGQKIMYTTLFMGKVCRKNSGFDKDKIDVTFGLTVWLCIFHFPLRTSQGIKVPFENKVMGLAHRSLVSPCHSFFLFPPFHSVLLSGWLLGTQELYWLSVLIKEDQALFSALLSFRLGRHPEGTPGSCWGWTLAIKQALGVGDGQGSLVCCGPWGCKESDTTQWLNWTELAYYMIPTTQHFVKDYVKKLLRQ